MAAARGSRTVSIDDAMRDAAMTGEDGMGVSQIAPPQPSNIAGQDFLPIGNELPYRPPQPSTPVYSSGTSSDIYYLITYNDAGQSTKIETLDEEGAMERLSELGASNAVSMLPTMNPAHWGGRYAIIRGSLVVPKEVTIIKLT